MTSSAQGIESCVRGGPSWQQGVLVGHQYLGVIDLNHVRTRREEERAGLGSVEGVPPCKDVIQRRWDCAAPSHVLIGIWQGDSRRLTGSVPRVLGPAIKRRLVCCGKAQPGVHRTAYWAAAESV